MHSWVKQRWDDPVWSKVFANSIWAVPASLCGILMTWDWSRLGKDATAAKVLSLIIQQLASTWQYLLAPVELPRLAFWSLLIVVATFGIVRRRMIPIQQTARHEISPAGNRRCGPLLLEDVLLEKADRPEIHYKRKLRVAFRNATDGDIVLTPPNWRTRPGDLDIQPDHPRVWELESGRGWSNNGWQGTEHPTVTVPSGRVVRTWIGLHPNSTEEDVRRRLVTGRLGVLSVSVSAAGIVSYHTIDL